MTEDLEELRSQLEDLTAIVKAIGWVMLCHEREKHGDHFPVDDIEREEIDRILSP